jgi:hypothetical protein
LQLKLIKIGARVVRHARAITFQLAEVAVTGPMVRAILTAIRRLRAAGCGLRLQTERKRLDRAISSAEKLGHCASTARGRSMRHPPSGASATLETIRAKRYFDPQA